VIYLPELFPSQNRCFPGPRFHPQAFDECSRPLY